MITPAPPNPYVGPRTFERKDAARFFGRETEARDLLALVGSQRLVLFYAQSGAGKSSLINTRLAPQLEARGLYVLPVGRVGGELPAGVGAVENIYLFNLMLSLDQGRDGRGGDPARLVGLTLSEFLHSLTSDDGQTWYYDPAVEADTSAEAGAEDAYTAANTVLIVDQFEEIITTHADRWPERAGFFQQIDAAMQADPRLRVVLTLREDYVAALDPYAQFLADKLRARFYMERMGVDAALLAVQQPARGAGRPFAPGVAAQLVDDLRKVRVPGQAEPQVGQYVEPVQLQVVCYQLWENLQRPSGDLPASPEASRKVADAITLADLQAAGDVDSALAAFYETAIAQVVNRPELGVSEQQLRTWFSTKLITEAGTRGTVFRDERSGLTAGLPNAAVEVLARQFLLRTELRAGGAWVELVHDRFVAPILRANRARQTPLALDAEAWLAAGKDTSRLYEGQQLKDAAAELDQHPEQHSEAERAFVDAGQARQAARDARWRRIVTGVTVALVLLFAVLAGVALVNAVQANQKATEAAIAQATAVAAQQNAEAERVLANQAREEAEAARQEADTARAETERLTRGIRADQLTVKALNVVDEDPPLALLLAAEGMRAQSDYTTTVILADPVTPQSPNPITRTAIVSETVVGSAQSNVHELLGLVGGVPLAGHESAVFDVAFSPDGRWLATASGDNNARLWDVTDPSAAPIVLAGHAAGVVAVAFSPDGRWLATGSGDNTARLWDVTDPSADPSVLAGHTGYVWAVAFSPDGRWLATASGDNTARLWDVIDPSATPIVLAGHESSVEAVAFSPDGRWLATASSDYTARLWDVTDPSAAPIVLAGHEGAVEAVAFSPDGRWLATASGDNTARLWDVTDPSADPSVLAGHAGAVWAVAFSPDGRWLATASYDNTARLWNVTDPSAAPSILAGHTDYVWAVAFSPDGRWLATRSDDNTARLWDVTDPSAAPIVLAGHESSVEAVAFSPDGRWLATGSNDNTARLWDVTDPSADPSVLAGHTGYVWAVAWSPATADANSPDGRWLATASWDDTARLWDVTDPTADPSVLAGHAGAVWAVAFSPDGRWLATGSDDNTARLWDVTDPSAAPSVLAGHAAGVVAVAFSPDGRWLATGSNDNTARLWDVTDPSADPSVLAGHESAIMAVAFSPDGRWLATASWDNTARLWNVTDPTAAPSVLAGHADVVVAVAFSPDGRWLATASSDDTARLWDVTDPNADPIVLAGHAGGVQDVAFSPDGRWLATASSDDTARLWDVTDPSADPIVLAGHADGVVAVAFSPDGRWLATASSDTARLWDVTDPNADPSVLAGHAGGVQDVAFSPDGRWLATGSGDNTARLWIWQVDDLLATVCRFAARNLTVEEWARYFQDKEYRKTCPQWPVHPRVIKPLLNDANALAQQGDVAAATTKFAEALRLDESLSTSPPGYVQLFCALRPGASSVEGAGALCSKLDVRIFPVISGESVTGTVATGAIDLWSLDAAASMTVTIDLMAYNSPLDAYLYLYAPEGSTVAENDDFSNTDSRIEVVLPQAGRYLIGAAGYGDSSGAYRLAVSLADAEP